MRVCECVRMQVCVHVHVCTCVCVHKRVSVCVTGGATPSFLFSPIGQTHSLSALSPFR